VASRWMALRRNWGQAALALFKAAIFSLAMSILGWAQGRKPMPNGRNLSHERVVGRSFCGPIFPKAETVAQGPPFGLVAFP
jgi:hypothetical protein